MRKPRKPGKNYYWVDGHWRKMPEPRPKKKKKELVEKSKFQKVIQALQNALYRFTGSKDPKDLRLAGKPIKGLKLKHSGGMGTKYKHPAGISKKDTYNMQYAVVETDKLITSHLPLQRFDLDKRFPAKIQDRDYKKKSEQAKVIDIATKLQPEYMLSNAITAAEGTPIITHKGIILSGNGRAMALKYAADSVPSSYAKYKDELLDNAHRFGLTREEIEQFNKPALVRVVDINAKSKEAEEFGRAANAKVGAARSEIREAAHLAEILPPELLMMVKDADEETLSTVLNQKVFLDFLKTNIPVKDRQAIFKEDGKLTDSGKAFVKKIMLIKCLGSPEVLEAMSDSWYRSFEYALPELIEMHQRPARLGFTFRPVLFE